MLEVSEPAIPTDWPEKLRFRKRPKPYSRSIAWTPVDSDARVPEDRPYELFVAQSTLREVRQHLITATTGEPFGFLLGQVVYCPWRETPYIVIDSVRRETQDLPPADEMDRFRHAWVAASRDARHRRGEVIGWYHRHGVLGLRLSEWDLRLQEEFFSEPWHCALIIASGRRGIIGGFVQRSRRARLFRKGLAPFRELVDLDAKLVNGLKPSCVDWQNYRAGESVSVIRAKWPAPGSRLKAWEGERHGPEATLPTKGDSVETPRSKKRRGALGGRSWRTGTPATPTRPPPTEEDARPVEEEAFEEIVRSADDAVVFESEERVGEPEAAPHAKKGPRQRPRPGKTRKPAGGGPEDRDFLETVWGPAPFEAEGEEPEVAEDETEARDAAASPGDADARRPRFELVPTFEPEPVETESPKSLEWLLSLVGDALAGRARAGEEADEDEAASEEQRTTEEAGAPADEAGAAAEADDAGAEAAESDRGASEPATAPAASGEAARRSPRGRRPAGRAFVVPSSDPEADTEAPIPVVVLGDDEKGRWQPSELQRRIAIGLAVILGIWLAYQSLLAPGPPEPPPDTTPPPSGLQAAAPPDEFVRLADAYLTQLQTYRERLVDYRLERVDCAGLAEGFGSLLVARASLAAYVAGRPALEERFDTLTGEFLAARQRFDATGCEPPPEPSPDDGSPDDGSETPAADADLPGFS